MADIAIFHPTIMFGGGGEAVCAHTIEALKDNHDLTLYTFGDLDLDEFNAFHGTSLSHSQITTALPLPKLMLTAIDSISDRIPLDTGFSLFKTSLSQWWFRNLSTRAHDLYISTYDEFFIDEPSIQYIHFPRYNVQAHKEYPPDGISPGRIYQMYRKICSKIATRSSSNTLTFVNSSWTQDLVTNVYGMDSQVLFPPVQIEEFEPLSWDQKDDGLVTIGRIDEAMRYEKIIRIIDRLHDRGHDINLHVIGKSDESDEYANKILQMADSREYIHIEGKLDRSELVKLVEQNKFGINAKEHEHFGMTVVELIAGGAIPFVHDSGGQTQIVNYNDELRFRGVDDAVEKIDAVLTDSDLQANLRSDLQETLDKYTSRRFQASIREAVERVLSQS